MFDDNFMRIRFGQALELGCGVRTSDLAVPCADAAQILRGLVLHVRSKALVARKMSRSRRGNPVAALDALRGKIDLQTYTTFFFFSQLFSRIVRVGLQFLFQNQSL